MSRPTLVLMVLVALTGCAAPGLAPVTPILGLEGNGCVPAPDFASAQPVPPPEAKAIDVLIDGACLAPENGPRRGYAVFRLPVTGEAYLVDIKSVPRGSTLFPPVVIILDAAGKETGRMERGTFTFHGSTLYAGLRTHPDDRYLVVESDPQLVGQGVSQIAEAVQVSSFGRGSFHTGSESTTTLAFAHNGLLSISTRKIPSAG